MSVMKNILIGLLVGSVFVIVFADMMGQLSLNYGYNSDNSSFNTTYNKLQNIQNLSDNVTKIIQDAEINSDSAFFTATVGSYKAVKLLYSTVAVVNSIFTELSVLLGLPNWVVILVVTIVSLTISILIISAFARWRM